MIARSHFDSRLVAFRVWCHYSEGVRKKVRQAPHRGRAKERSWSLGLLWVSCARRGDDSEGMKMKVSAHGVPSLEDPPRGSEISFSVALLGWLCPSGLPEASHGDAVLDAFHCSHPHWSPSSCSVLTCTQGCSLDQITLTPQLSDFQLDGCSQCPTRTCGTLEGKE